MKTAACCNPNEMGKLYRKLQDIDCRLDDDDDNRSICGNKSAVLQ